MGDVLRGLAFAMVAVFGVPVLMALVRANMTRQMAQNESVAPPSTRNLRWHIQHIREDLMLLAGMVAVANVLLAYIAFVK